MYRYTCAADFPYNRYICCTHLDYNQDYVRPGVDLSSPFLYTKNPPFYISRSYPQDVYIRLFS